MYNRGEAGSSRKYYCSSRCLFVHRLAPRDVATSYRCQALHNFLHSFFSFPMQSYWKEKINARSLVLVTGLLTQEAVFSSSPAVKKQICTCNREHQISLRKPTFTLSFQAASVNNRRLGSWKMQKAPDWPLQVTISKFIKKHWLSCK